MNECATKPKDKESGWLVLCVPQQQQLISKTATRTGRESAMRQNASAIIESVCFDKY